MPRAKAASRSEARPTHAARRACFTAPSNRKEAACCSRSITTMKVDDKRRLALRPYHAARAVFPTGRDAPDDYLDRCLATIAKLEPEIGAFVHLNEAGA